MKRAVVKLMLLFMMMMSMMTMMMTWRMKKKKVMITSLFKFSFLLHKCKSFHHHPHQLSYHHNSVLFFTTLIIFITKFLLACYINHCYQNTAIIFNIYKNSAWREYHNDPLKAIFKNFGLKPRLPKNICRGCSLGYRKKTSAGKKSILLPKF